jgi:hypothetical protein
MQCALVRCETQAKKANNISSLLTNMVQAFVDSVEEFGMRSYVARWRVPT